MLGIVGGMGPRATARLYLSLAGRVSAQTGELPELLVHSVAMTRKIEDAYLAGRVGPRSPELVEARTMLAAAVDVLVGGGAELLVMPCNTLQDELRSLCVERGVEHVDMLDATVEAIAAAGARRVLILGTTTTCRADLYGQRLCRHGIDCLYPTASEQALVEAHIRGALDLRAGQRSGLPELVQAYARACDGVVLACTDLSDHAIAEAEALVAFDSLECLAAAATRRLPGLGVRSEPREQGAHGR